MCNDDTTGAFKAILRRLFYLEFLRKKTNEEDKEVQTETLTIKARPMACGYVKAKTADSTTDTVCNNWYKTVYEPTAVAE